MTVDELSRIANRLRLDVVETVHLAGDGHPGPCMSEPLSFSSLCLACS